MKRSIVRHPRNKKGQVTTCPICGGYVIGPAVYDQNKCRQKAYRIRNDQLKGRWANELTQNKVDEPAPDPS